MSSVTDIIVLCPTEEQQAIIDVNLWLMARGITGVLIEASRAAGGNKVLQADVWMGAFNHFDTSAFKVQFEAALLRHPTPGVWQLLIKEENAEKFDLIEYAWQYENRSTPALLKNCWLSHEFIAPAKIISSN